MRVALGSGWIDLESGDGPGGARLRPLELAVLRHLVRHEGRTVTVDELLREVWGYGPGIRTKTVFSTVYRLRRSIEPDPAAPRHLLSVAGGYRFVADAPHAPGGLVGRDALLARVIAAVAPPGARVTLTGAPGIGKSAVRGSRPPSGGWGRRRASCTTSCSRVARGSPADGPPRPREGICCVRGSEEAACGSWRWR